ncbi:hypothetical protein GGR28_003015 [Lewinella aquimaris]|uniref:Uncharacterized protein n=1 Tax=Neolewinella aquimaris TaxID=1835722 RepID=A0A840E5C6_9BACT|nr:hypothetical protein [Neolewinella aquimaris]MBB4080381.1 hypothetical protein [Neolewinella aquimaris]
MKSLLFLFLLCTCVPALATTPAEPLITRSAVEAYNLSLTVANMEKQRTRIEIRDAKNNSVVFGTTVKNHNGYRASFNLSELDPGRYIVTVKKGDTVRQQIIRKSEVGIMCSDWN